MGGKKKGKKNDDWEDEADVIVAASKTEEPAAATTREITRLDKLFAEAIQRGKQTSAEYDRATDVLASGAKTEDELIFFYFPNEAKPAADDDAADAASEGKGKKGKNNRTWRAERDGRNADLVDVSEALDGPVDSAAAAAMETAAVEQLHAELFGVVGAPHALDMSADGLDARDRVFRSELQFDEWRRASGDVPKELPLPNMTGAALIGQYGLSTHAGGMVRLWDVSSGRRLGAAQHKLEVTACTARGVVAAVGDAVGAVLLYSTEADFAPTRIAPLGSAAVRSVALVALDDDAKNLLVVASAEDGGLSASLCACDTWPPTQARVEPPLAPLAADAPMHLCAGPGARLFSAAGAQVAMHDVQRDATSWSARDADWSASVAAGSLGPSTLLDGVAAMGLGGVATATAAGGAAGGSSVAHAAGGAAVGASATPTRLVSYSPSWQLLASAASGVVALWDVRAPGSSGPAAAVQLAGSDASWIHLDESDGLAGHLLVAPTGGGLVHLYDVRRVPCGRAASAARAVATFAPPPNATAACFAAQGSTLVVGGGAKCGTVLKYCGDRADLSKGEEEDDEEEGGKKSKGKEKKKRIVRKEVRGSRQSRCA